MPKFWFRKNHELASPARVAEATNLVIRQEAYDRAKDATIHLLSALKQWPGFDSTGNINGVIDHTLVNIDRLDDALDDLRDQVDKFRGQQVAEMVRRSGHPSTGAEQDLPQADLRIHIDSMPTPRDMAANAGGHLLRQKLERGGIQ